MPQFSVLLPTHNRADVLPFAVQSVLAQTCRISNCSWSATAARTGPPNWSVAFGTAASAGLTSQSAPLRLREPQRRAARGHRAPRRVHDHDDLWLPDHLELLSACLEDHGAEWAYSRCVWAGPERRTFAELLQPEPPADPGRVPRRPWIMPSTSVMHRRECLDKYGYLDESLPASADWELWTRIIKGGDSRISLTSLSPPACTSAPAGALKTSPGCHPPGNPGGSPRVGCHLSGQSQWRRGHRPRKRSGWPYPPTHRAGRGNSERRYFSPWMNTPPGASRSHSAPCIVCGF